jgi:uncharacterized protein
MNATKLYRNQGLLIHLPLWIIALCLFFWICHRWMPLPPTELSIAAGRSGAGYRLYAERYTAALKEHGIELKILDTAGSGENIQRLQSTANPADIGMVQGGYAMSEINLRLTGDIETIAQIYVEPIWVFSRNKDLDSLFQLQGKRVAIGQLNSGSRAVALRMLEQMRIEPKTLELSESLGTVAADALIEGKIDALIFVAAVESPLVQKLLPVPGVYLANLKRSAAMTERLPYLDGRFVAAGGLSASNNIPPQDMTLLATQATLVVRKDLHPITKRLLASMALDVHSGPGVMHRTGEFPNLKRLEFPSAAEARRVLRSGLPWLEKNFSGQLAQWVYRLLFIGLPLVIVTLLLSQSIPAYLRWRIESSINQWYGELKFIENDLKLQKPGGLEMARFRNQLRGVESQIVEFDAPKRYMQRVYVLRKHVAFVKDQLQIRHGR